MDRNCLVVRQEFDFACQGRSHFLSLLGESEIAGKIRHVRRFFFCGQESANQGAAIHRSGEFLVRSRVYQREELAGCREVS